MKATYDAKLDRELLHEHGIGDIRGLDNPILIKGRKSSNFDSSLIKKLASGWAYVVVADNVVDTNTGQTFMNKHVIVWYESEWIILNGDSNNDIVGSGERITGIHAGNYGEYSLTDDYEYTCVFGGIAGVAIWKKKSLFQSI